LPENKLWFDHAIVRRPGSSLVNGLSDANLGKPDFSLAEKQHQRYVEALRSCQVKVDELNPLENFPDSTFVEDVALLTPHYAIVTNPGAPSRNGEPQAMLEPLKEYYKELEFIQRPGTLDAGDVMMVGSHFFIGLSQRTNALGAQQLIDILKAHGLTGSVVSLRDVLHLKTGVAYLEHETMLVCGEFVSHPDFQKYKLIEIPETESYAANSIWVNDRVLMPLGYPISSQKVQAAGYEVLEIDVSEFKKVDGGLSCLSLRF